MFRAVTPRTVLGRRDPDRAWSTSSWATWFDPSKTVTGLVSIVETGVVGDVERVSYRIDGRDRRRPTVIEQVAYYSHSDGQITQLRLVCSGFRPV